MSNRSAHTLPSFYVITEPGSFKINTYKYIWILFCISITEMIISITGEVLLYEIIFVRVSLDYFGVAFPIYMLQASSDRPNL